MKHRLLVLLLCLLTLPVVAYGEATINVESVTIAPGGTATIDVTVSAVPAPGVTDIQGTLSYDGSVIHVASIDGLNDMNVLASSIDNAAGTVVFAATGYGSGWVGITTGGILRITVEAVGTAGDSCVLGLTMAVFRDADGNAIANSVGAGAVTISATNAPSADFSFLPTNPTLGQTVTFTDASTDTDGTINAWHWDFGDGSTSNSQNPTHQYANGGTFNVALTVTDNDGLSGSTSIPITVTGPTAAFTFTPVAPTTQTLVSFVDQSTDPTGTITSRSWAFGDGAVSAEQDPTHTFATSGTYVVTLTIESSSGATVSTSHSIVVLNTPPIAGFTFNPSAPSVGDTITFSATGSGDPDGHIILYEWDFESDGTYEISGASASTITHVYTQAGSHNVTLRVTDDAGAQTSKTIPVPVAGISVGPTADFTYNPDSPSMGQAISFNGSNSSAPAGTITMYEWDFDDIAGAVDATGVSVVHAFTTPGPHSVTLKVTDSNGASDTITKVVAVGTNPPTATFSFTPLSPKVGEVIALDASDSKDELDGRIIGYQWDFDDDGVAGDIDAVGVKVNHSFSTAGTHKVTLTVTDNDGNAATDTQWIEVKSNPPTAAFTFTPANPNTGQIVSFDAKDSSDSDGTIILYEWNFGDGARATGLAVTHAYKDPGVYPVSLKVTDNDTEFDVTTQGVPVEMGGTGGVNQPPVANFTFAPAKGPDVNLNEVVTFKAEGCSDKDGSVAVYEWDFNNDGVYDATGTTVTHIFHRGGGQIVTLRVLDNEGAPGFKTEVVPVEFIRPTADFSVSPAEPRVGDVITFDGSGSSDPDGRVDFYEWDFDNDGVVDATGMTVTHTFATGGGKPVTLKVTDNDGVSSSVTKTVTVAINNPPIANFAISPAAPTTADTITFQDQSVDTDGSITSWNWDFGDGSTSTVQSPSHKYDTAKAYSVTLVVTDNEGATGSVTQSITVSVPLNQPPVASFKFSPSLPQVGSVVTFSDTSTDSDGTITAWAWDFGDGATSQAQNPSHTYSATGTYSVTLSVTDNEGARSTVVKKQIQVAAAGAEVGLYSYPNPASRQASIVYYLPTGATDPVLRIYNIAGALVFQQTLTVGASPYTWDLNSTGGTAQPNGLYLCVVVAKDANGRTIKSPIFKLLIAR